MDDSSLRSCPDNQEPAPYQLPWRRDRSCTALSRCPSVVERVVRWRWRPALRAVCSSVAWRGAASAAIATAFTLAVATRPSCQEPGSIDRVWAVCAPCAPSRRQTAAIYTCGSTRSTIARPAAEQRGVHRPPAAVSLRSSEVASATLYAGRTHETLRLKEARRSTDGL